MLFGKDNKYEELHKYAQAVASSIKWSQIARYNGFTINEYLNKIKNTTDTKILTDLAKALPSFLGFGGIELSGFQRRLISSAANNKLNLMGLIGSEKIKKRSPV